MFEDTEINLNKVGKITLREAMEAAVQYKSKEMLKLIEEAVILKRKHDKGDRTKKQDKKNGST